MKRLILLLFLVSATACGKGPILDLNIFTSYVNKFEAYATQYGHPEKVVNLQMRLGQLDPYVEGVCYPRQDGDTPLIIVDTKYWSKATETSKEVTIFHELGHCILRRLHHQTAVFPGSGIPISIMHPYGISDTQYTLYQNYYLQELFAGAND